MRVSERDVSASLRLQLKTGMTGYCWPNGRRLSPCSSKQKRCRLSPSIQNSDDGVSGGAFLCKTLSRLLAPFTMVVICMKQCVSCAATLTAKPVNYLNNTIVVIR
jgi:hypothetical protein